jgi:hypothetical protein
LLGLVQFLAQPGHGAVEVLKVQFLHAGDDLPPAPLLRRPVAASGGPHDPVQHRQENGPLDGEGELAVRQRVGQHRRQAQLLPQPPEDQGGAEAVVGENLGLAGAVIG